jgi:type II secretory pathway component PulF
MPTFQYRALQSDGKIAEGQLEAAGRPDAFRQIETRGLRPVSLSERASAKNGSAKNGAAKKSSAAASDSFSFKFGSQKVSAKQLENFTRLLSSLLAAGVPLSRALVILCKESSNPAATAKWREVHDLVIDGMSLADAMAKSPETFPRVYTAMVEAGETGGFIDVVLAHPCILLVLAIGVLVVLLTFFIPKFQTVFNSIHGSLPLITQIIIAASHAIRSYGLFVGVGIVATVLLVRNWFVSEKGRRVWETFLLRSPIIGPLTAQFAMARFCRMLGTLLGAGVPLIQGLNVARRSIGNQILVDAVEQSIQAVQQGGRLGQSLAECKGLFPGSALEMISVAEESGKLDSELVRIANVTESDLDRHLKTAVAFAEPAMLFFIAAFIGVIFIGMLLPVLTMSEHIK